MEVGAAKPLLYSLNIGVLGGCACFSAFIQAQIGAVSHYKGPIVMNGSASRLALVSYAIGLAIGSIQEC